MDDEQTWLLQKQRFPAGTLVHGLVIRVAPFGVFVEVAEFRSTAVLLVTHFEDDGPGRELHEYPQVGEAVTAVIVGFVDDTRQVRLSTRASDMVKGKRAEQTDPK